MLHPAKFAMRPLNQKQQTGVTMIEVLATIIVTTVGLLGIAGLQAIGARTNQSAYLRTQATTLAYDMADRLRSNVRGAINIDYTVTPPGVTHPIHGMAPAINAACETPAGCSADNMVSHDYARWRNEIATLLPGDETTNATGVVCIDSTPNDGDPTAPQCDNVFGPDQRNPIYVIKVWWVDYEPTRFTSGAANTDSTGTTWRRMVVSFTMGPRTNIEQCRIDPTAVVTAISRC